MTNKTTRRSFPGPAALFLVLAGGSTWLAAGCAAPAADAPGFRTSRLEIEVSGLPAGAEVPFSLPIDLGSGPDERTIRLLRDGRDVPLQFSASAQPRPKERRLLPGTPPATSLSAEYAAGELAPVRVAGDLAWAARNGTYRLEFGVPLAGRQVQVPFPPQNLRGFDEENRATPVRHFPRMQVRPQWPLEGAVHVSDLGSPFTSLHLSARRPYLYPVIGPDGIALTEVGKPHDPTGSHAHHYSLWVAHNSVGGKDFWSERGGTIVHEGFDLMEDGPVFARLVQRTRWSADERPVLRERRTLTFHATPEAYRLIDVDLELSAPAQEAVVVGKSTFGFLAVRVAQSMTVFDGGGEIRNAEGARNERDVHLRKSRWIDLSGPVAPGKRGGVAILDHPSNPNHPTAWHCRDDGWAGASAAAEGPISIAPGKPLRLRYRVVLHRGDAVAGEVARRFEEFAAPASARVVR